MSDRVPHGRVGRRFAATTTTAALMIATLATAAGLTASAGPALANVDSEVYAQLAQADTAQFLVYLDKTADLTGADELESKEEKGAYVYETLTSFADETQADLRAELEDRGVEYTAFWISNTLLVEGDEDLVAELAARSDVSHIEAHTNLELLQASPTSQFAEWGVADIGADHAWNVFRALGQKIVVASIDTGVQFTHPALVRQYRGNLGAGVFDHNYNWFDPAGICPAPAPCDNNNHGTHVTGTMVGDDGLTNKIGVAPLARWIAAKGCESFFCTQASLLASGQWMIAPTDLNGLNPDPTRAPHVINNSWGGGSGNTWYQATINAWVTAGIFPVFAAGNSGAAGCGSASSPGDNIPAYAAGAYDINHAIAPFSGRGPSQVDNFTIKPNVSAPGVNIRSSVVGGYATFSGTSMAAPHVAGAVALVWSARPLLIGNVAFTRHILDSTATDVNDLTCGGVPANNNVWGQGRLNAFQAVWLAKTL
jgi:subtilisin family serine protease